MKVSVQKVCKKYGNQKVLDEISFDLKAGEIVGLLGPNGAGKSTLMKILSSSIYPTSGNVFINGMEIKNQTLAIKKLIGYLPENNPLYPNMFIREYLNFCAGFYELGKKKNARIDEMIVLTGLTKEINKKIGLLSKGYKQRVGLAQALLHDPQFLILDEPTSGLDPNQLIEIRKLIKSFSQNKTVLFSSHIMQEIEALCDRIIIIDEGKIIADDTSLSTIQSAQKNELVLVEFDIEIDKELIERFFKDAHVNSINSKTWAIDSLKVEAVIKEINVFANRHNLTIISLQKEKRSLEEIFQELTNKT